MDGNTMLGLTAFFGIVTYGFLAATVTRLFMS